MSETGSGATVNAAGIVPQPIDSSVFAPFGDVVDAAGKADYLINNDLCGRFHDRARLDVDRVGRLGLSLFDSRCFALPITVSMVERHPLASQTFIPMSGHPYLVVVAPDDGGRPGTPLAFLAKADQAVNLLRGTWHGVLTPLADDSDARGLFAIVDGIGAGDNCDTHDYPVPYRIALQPRS